MFEGSQHKRFPSFPVSHPSPSGAFQTLSFGSTSTHQIRVDPSSDADANLIYLPSDEGRKTTDLTADEIFALNKSSLVNIFHTQIILPRDTETKYLSSGEKQIEVTKRFCPSTSLRTKVPSLASQTRIVPSLDPDKMYALSWE